MSPSLAISTRSPRCWWCPLAVSASTHDHIHCRVSDPAARPDSTFADRYRAIGLERNPFTAPRAGDATCRAFVPRGLPDPPRAWSKTLVQVIGDSGFGKSSHLEAWRSRTPGPHHYIARTPYVARWDSPPMADHASGGTIYGDEIDRMPRPLRHRWFTALARAGATLVIGTHVDLTGLGERAGFDVRTYHLTPFDRLTLGTVVERRLDSVRIRDDVPLLFTEADLDQVFAQSAGVPRAVDDVCHRRLAAKVR